MNNETFKARNGGRDNPNLALMRALTEAGVDLRQLVGTGDRQAVRVARLEDPSSVGGDADRHDVVPLGVDGLEHASRRDAGDGVLAGAAAEDDGDAGTVRGALHSDLTLPRPAPQQPTRRRLVWGHVT